MSVFTKVGSSIWMWPPFRRLERSVDDAVGRGAKLLYLHLYTAPEAKASVPGLYAGSVTTISESMGTPPDEVRRFLDRLIEDDLVEHDVERRVLRLVQLPDAGESPTNGNTIRGWWRKFQNVPACAVRDAHVTVLKWVMEEWSRSNDKPISADHMKAWEETFGRVAVPAPRPSKRKHLQTSLFAATSEPFPASSEPFPNPSPVVDEPETLASSPSSSSLNKIRDSETLSKPFRKERDQDQDQDRDLGSFSSSGAEGQTGAVPVDNSASGPTRPRLTLVPGTDDITALLADLASGHGLDPRHAAMREGTLDGLGRTIGQLRAAGATRDEQRAVGAWVKSRCELGRVPGDPFSKISAWAAIPGMVAAALKAVRERARQHADVQDQLAAMTRGVYQ